MTLYSLRAHPNVALQAVTLYDTFCQADEQVFMIYKEEIQNHVKSGFEYLEVVGDILPPLAQVNKEKAINCGLMDYLVDLCSREAENDSKI